jgi:NAD(P)-dependent dehydrogenase (short-subunit alcohol dehydrogenase family)
MNIGILFLIFFDFLLSFITRKMTETPKTWLITGCSSGFGELFVRQVRALGNNVIATGRNAEKRLAHLQDTGARILDLDVTAPASEIKAKMDEAWGLYPNGIDVVVNNAGYILSGAVEELTYAMSLHPSMLFPSVSFFLSAWSITLLSLTMWLVA